MQLSNLAEKAGVEKAIKKLRKTKAWMKRVYRGDAFQDGGINAMDIAIDDLKELIKEMEKK
jgi:hypothetical protein